MSDNAEQAEFWNGRMGEANKTIDAYTRAVRRLAGYLNRCPDNVSIDELISVASSTS